MDFSNKNLPSERAASLAHSFLASRTASTTAAYTQDLKNFSVFLGTTNSEEGCYRLITSGQGQANEIVMRYRSHLREKKCAPTTINRRLAALRSLVSFCNTIGLISWQLIIKNEKIESYRNCTQALDLPSFKALLKVAACQKNEEKAARDTAILFLLFGLGLRRQEVLRISLPEDINLNAGTVAILGKGRTQKQAIGAPSVRSRRTFPLS